MLSQRTIQDALEAHLTAFPGGMDIAWPLYEPKVGVAYLSPKLASCVRRTVGAGVDGSIQYDGIYAVTVRRPADEGAQSAGEVAEALVGYFGRGQALQTADGDPVVLMDVTEGPSSTSAGWVSLPVMVTFAASK